MVKKKGFTLLELLAVIVILSIILVIAIPSVSNILSDAKLNAYIANEKMVVKATKNLIMMDENRLPSNIGDTVIINITELQTENLLGVIKNIEDNASTCGGYVLIRKMATSEYDYRPYIKCGNDYRSEGLIAWYPFEGNANDISGSSYNGTASSISYVQDGLNSVGSFNGSSLITVPNFYNSSSANPVFLGTSPSSANNFNGNSTYSAWVKPTVVDTNPRYVLSDGNVNEGYISFINSSIRSNWSGTVLAYTVTVQANSWYYVTMTHERDNGNGSFTIELYVNGILRSNATYAVSTTTEYYGPDSPLTIGSNWVGLMDDIRIYDKVLTSEEILENYNIEKLKFGL